MTVSFLIEMNNSRIDDLTSQ